MNIVLRKVLVVFFIFGILPSIALDAKKILPFNDIEKKVERARSSVEDIYYELVKNHYFDDVNNLNNIYANNLVIGTNLDEDPVAKGAILLNLIVWLEKKNDRDSRFLLRKINRLYHLEFHRTLSALGPELGSYKESLLGTFHDLSSYKTFHPAIGVIYPFGTSITKAILTLFVINKTAVPFIQKKESAFYTLEKIKQEMFHVNSNLGKDMVQDDVIRAFIFGLESFGIKQTLVESKLFRNLIIISLAAIVIGFIVYRWDVVGSGLNTVGTKLNELLNQMFDGFFEKAGEGVVKGALKNEDVRREAARADGRINELQEQIVGVRQDITNLVNDFPNLVGRASENAVRGALHGAARVGQPPVQQNPVVQPPDPAEGENNNQPDQQPPAQPAGNGVLIQNANDVNPDIQVIVREALAPVIQEARKGWGGWLLLGKGNNQQDQGQQRGWFGSFFSRGNAGQPGGNAGQPQ